MFHSRVMRWGYRKAEFTTGYYCACTTYLFITMSWVYRVCLYLGTRASAKPLFWLEPTRCWLMVSATQYTQTNMVLKWRRCSKENRSGFSVYPLDIAKKLLCARVYCSLEFSTDHCPVIASLTLKMRWSIKTHSQNLCYNVRKMNDVEIESQYSVEVQNRFLYWAQKKQATGTLYITVLPAQPLLAWVILSSLRKNGSRTVLGKW